MNLFLFTIPQQEKTPVRASPQKELRERAHRCAQALNKTTSGVGSEEKGRGEQGRGWSSCEALEVYQRRRAEATRELLVCVRQLGELLLHLSGVQQCTHHLNQLSGSGFCVMGQPITCKRDRLAC